MNAENNRAIKELEEIGQEWTAAEQRGDATVFARMLADDFMLVGPLGFMLTKDQWTEQFISGNLKYTSLSWDEVRFRVYGDAAIAIGRRTQAGTYQDRDIAGQFRETQILVRQEGQWRLAGIHLSPIAQGS